VERGRNWSREWHRTAIFFRPRIGSVSPAVRFDWPVEVVDLLNQFPPGTPHLCGDAEDACADFIAACSALPPIPMGRSRTEKWPRSLSVGNLPLRWDRLGQLTAEVDTPEYGVQFPAWLFAELDRVYAHVKKRRELPVLVDQDLLRVTQGGEVLCRHLDCRSEPWKPGQPLWVAVDRTRKPRRPKRVEPGAAADGGGG